MQPEDNAARQAALALLLAAGPDGTGASAIARGLAEEHGTTRQTVVGWLKTWTEDGTAVRVGTGTKTRYVHRNRTPGNPAEG
ncbi:Helix-turn-helix domain-containing protein OS=Streptomyces microflavus OX=1919 GN=Smic_41590 PE=4 SV=1 [Streptomyces microflavus]